MIVLQYRLSIYTREKKSKGTGTPFLFSAGTAGIPNARPFGDVNVITGDAVIR